MTKMQGERGKGRFTIVCDCISVCFDSNRQEELKKKPVSACIPVNDSSPGYTLPSEEGGRLRKEGGGWVVFCGDM